ncbi:serine/threonine dehydratase [Spiractinospora alimapuensis]|uniref:serine/threonine dehydratase n=1 Tax=Spiractinospora alimapuensis TaxID=2820884 RepID=UPI001F00DCAF|nr:serine/threonine dehydratase [Spiractinospora alimapuensis]QVQ52899.1 serine/threonine dehydratase [Spiractinospora alimapuensis]
MTVNAPDLAHIDVPAAQHRVSEHIRRTPVLRARLEGRDVLFKLEHLQLTGAFKIRGALNALLAMRDRRGLPDLVVTASGGNHGLAVATAAALLGIRAEVYVPESVPEAKAARLESSGAALVRVGDHYAQAAAAARDRAVAVDAPYVHAYDDPDVVSGQGTVAAEIVQDVPECDGIAAAVGGAGLIAGITAGAPHLTITGVEPEGCQSLHAALAAGHPVDSPVDSVASSALGATRVGETPFAVLRSRPPRSVLVADSEIISARNRLWEEFRIAVEPAAAAPFAAWLAGTVPGDLPCLVMCGANSTWTPTDPASGTK